MMIASGKEQGRGPITYEYNRLRDGHYGIKQDNEQKRVKTVANTALATARKIQKKVISGAGPDEKVGVTGSDTGGYLFDKIKTDCGLVKAVVGSPGNQQLQLALAPQWCNLPEVVDSIMQDIDALADYDIISSDGSVTIHSHIEEDGTVVFDLSSCCANVDDHLVLAGSGDQTPGTLEQKITTCDPNSPIQISTTGTSNKKIVLCFDESKLQSTDEKVKRKPGCAAVFGNQLLSAGRGITITDQGCNGKISINDRAFHKPTRRFNVEADLDIVYGPGQQDDLPNNGWYCIEGSGKRTNATNNTAFNTYTFTGEVVSGSSSTGSGICHAWVCPKSGYYFVNMSPSYGYNRGVEACRVTLASSIPGKEVLLNTGIANSNNQALAQDETADNDSFEDLTILYGQGTSDIVYIEQGQIIYGLFGRMNNEVLGGPGGTTADGKMRIFSTPFGFNPFGSGNFNIPNPTQGTYWSVTWDSDINGDTRFLI